MGYRRITTWMTRPLWHWLVRRTVIGEVRIELPAGPEIARAGSEPGPSALITIHRPARLFFHIVAGGGVGFAEAYLKGCWDTADLAATLEFAGRNLDRYARGGRRTRALEPARKLWKWFVGRRRAEIGSVDDHYNLGNDFYQLWLDGTMTYSSAVFADGITSLEDAQTEKYRRLAVLADLKPSDHVLEIGCGWGGFAEYAATQIGCRVTGLTLSTEQAEYAAQRLKEAGVDHLTEIKLQDFRDETGEYDKVVSIEMIESIPAELWPALFGTIRETLRSGGRVAMQAITIAEDIFDSLLRRNDFISKHIFPGGSLPAVTTLRSLGMANGMPVAGISAYGDSYAETLRQWRMRFATSWSTTSGGRFNERFRRLWEYYLAYCEAGFRIGRINVHQVAFAAEP